MFVSSTGRPAQHHAHPVRPAAILHADLDSFYASVEQRDNPRLRGRPVLVGTGVVLAASYEAKARGVRSPMNGLQARALCPDAVVVLPRMAAYAEASKRVFGLFRDTTPLVEGVSIDEAFLDVSGLWRLGGTPASIAHQLRQRVRCEIGLPITVGIARTKFIAKVASAVGKPDGLLEVPPGTELDFLHPLPVERLWGVGAVTARKLHDHEITTVGQLAALGERRLCAILGRGAGRHLFALAWGHDPRRVDTGRRRRSIGAQRALGRRPRTSQELESMLAAIVDRLGKRLRAAHRLCQTVVLRLRFDDFSRATRSHTLAVATDRTDTVLAAAWALLRAALPMVRARGITLLGLSLTNLHTGGARQLELFGAEGPGLDHALDVVRDRFGATAVVRAANLGRDPGISVPLLPD